MCVLVHLCEYAPRLCVLLHYGRHPLDELTGGDRLLVNQEVLLCQLPGSSH